jgi:dihydrofolate reductase
MKIVIIAAIAKNGVIGKSNGEMSWHLKEEFQHFKKTTLGFPVLMGRKTFESLGKPLKLRENIIVTSDKKYSLKFEETFVVHTIQNGIELASTFGKDKLFIIGGGEIYKQSILVADEMVLSHLSFEAEGDVYFPYFDNSLWYLSEEISKHNFTIVYYSKK